MDAPSAALHLDPLIDAPHRSPVDHDLRCVGKLLDAHVAGAADVGQGNVGGCGLLGPNGDPLGPLHAPVLDLQLVLTGRHALQGCRCNLPCRKTVEDDLTLGVPRVYRDGARSVLSEGNAEKKDHSPTECWSA